MAKQKLMFYTYKYADSDFLFALNPDVKLGYTILHTDLLNNVMFTVARVLNQSLDRYIIDYEDDVFAHWFFDEITLESRDVALDDINTAKEVALSNLNTIQEHLKEHCINIIHKNKDIVKDIPTTTIFNLYNGGECLPDKYKHLKDKLWDAIGGWDPNDKENYNTYAISVILPEMTTPFKFPLMSDFLIKSNMLESYGNMCYTEENVKKYKDYDISLYDPITFLCDNLDLMAEHLLGYCYIEINQMNITSKKEWHEAIETRILEKNMTMKQYVVDLIEKELYKAIEAGILEKNTTMKQYLVDLIERDLAMVNNKKPVVETMYNENNELYDGVLDTDSDDNETLEKEQQRLIDILFEMNRMKDKKAKQLP